MSDLDMMALLKKMQEQLTSLERKVDTLVNKSQERPYNKERSFAKPFQKYDNGPRHGRGYNDQGHKKEFGQGRPFAKRPGGFNRGFRPKKKPFFNKASS